MAKFKVGDRVTLSSTSKWVKMDSHKKWSNNPIGIGGTISEIEGEGTYYVAWDNNRENGCYTDQCLLPFSDSIVTVSSLDYADSDDLDDEDKAVIKQYISEVCHV